VDGTKVYEFALKQGRRSGKHRSRRDGKFHSAEEPIASEADLPAKVKEGFRKKYPDAKVISMRRKPRATGRMRGDLRDRH